MTLPPSLTAVTVKATIVTAAGLPERGYITLEPETWIGVPADGAIIAPAPVRATLDSVGHAELTVVATDEATSPTDWLYRVQIATGNARTYLITLPAATPVVDLADITPSEPGIPSTIYATKLELDELDAAKVSHVRTISDLVAGTYLDWNIDAPRVPDNPNAWQWRYLSEVVAWFNEVWLPRFRAPASAPNEVVLKLFPRLGDALQVPDVNGNVLAGFRADGSLISSAWTDIVIDSPDTVGKYSAHANGAGGEGLYESGTFNAPQVRLVDGGRGVELRGRIDVVPTGGVVDETVATTVPTAVSLGGKLISAVPPRVRGFVAMGSGGGIRLVILPNGKMKVLGSALTQPYILLDNLTYTREA